MSGFWSEFKVFLGKPFSADMDAMDWFWFLGLLIVLSAIWAIIFRHLSEALK